MKFEDVRAGQDFTWDIYPEYGTYRKLADVLEVNGNEYNSVNNDGNLFGFSDDSGVTLAQPFVDWDDLEYGEAYGDSDGEVKVRCINGCLNGDWEFFEGEDCDGPFTRATMEEFLEAAKGE